MATNPSSKPATGGGMQAFFQDRAKAVVESRLAAQLERAPNGELRRIALDKLRQNPFQPRAHIDEDRLAELAETIAKDGLIQAITVRRREGEESYDIIAGHRRAAAFKLLLERATDDAERARWTAIPAQEKLEIDDALMARLALHENFQREDLSPVEAADALAAYQAQHGLQTAQLAEELGLEYKRVQRLLRLTGAPAAVRDGVTRGVMVPVVGEAGEPLTTPKGRMKQEHRHLDLLVAIEVIRAHDHFAKKKPKKAEEETAKLVERILSEGWGFRRVSEEVERILGRGEKGAGRSDAARIDASNEGPADKPLFTKDESRLTVFLARASAHVAEHPQRAALEQELEGLLGAIRSR